MSIKDKLYDYVVRKNENVRYEYEKYVVDNIDEHNKRRFKHWKFLWKLFVHYRIKKRKEPLYYANNKEVIVQEIQQNSKQNIQFKSIQNTKLNTFKFAYPEINKPESMCCNQIPPHQFVKQLLQYDVVSFDVFDTLILRSISEPKSVFTLIGERLDYLSFQRIRIRAQSEAREKCIRTRGTNEMSLEDIYEVIFRKTGIPIEIGIKAEMEVEKDICYANPYMKRVFDILKSFGKRIIISSDMYMSRKQIQELLENAGYHGFDEIYVSSEFGCSKANGRLYNVIYEHEGYNKRIIHVGDNPNSDIKNAKQKGITATQYINVNTAGNKYRCDGMSQLVRAAYRGVINAQLHCGMYKYSIPYEFGFVYGGIYILGFVNWIHQYALTRGIEKILFLARDGYVYKKVFDQMFDDVENQYVYWSRQANMKYAAKYQKEQYLLRNINHKLNRNIKLSSILEEAKISFIEKDFLELGINLEEFLDNHNKDIFEKIICKNWDRILTSYEIEKNVAKKYLENIIGDCKKIAVVEVGWVGTSQEGLKKIIENEISQSCEVYCLSASSASSESGDNLVQAMSQYYDSYLFSHIYNNDLTAFHRDENGSKKTILFELFSQASHPSFKGFKINDNGEVEMEFDLAEAENYDIFKEIIDGELDFCNIYINRFKKFPILFNVSGHDAYMPFKTVMRKFDYAKRNLGNIKIAETVGLNGTEGEMILLKNRL